MRKPSLIRPDQLWQPGMGNASVVMPPHGMAEPCCVHDLQMSLIALVLSSAAHAAAAAPETVHFTSLDGTTNLIAYLSRPEGDAPRPAMVLLHGCSGLVDRSRPHHGACTAPGPGRY